MFFCLGCTVRSKTVPWDAKVLDIVLPDIRVMNIVLQNARLLYIAIPASGLLIVPLRAKALPSGFELWHILAAQGAF